MTRSLRSGFFDGYRWKYPSFCVILAWGNFFIENLSYFYQSVIEYDSWTIYNKKELLVVIKERGMFSMEQNSTFLDRLFHLRENGTTVKTEIMAGITTFMTMAYILVVNPNIMSSVGMDKGAVLTATALAGCLGTLLMAVFANYPFGLAPGMGLNAFFAFTVVAQMGYTWQMALAAVFVEGVIFIVCH